MSDQLQGPHAGNIIGSPISQRSQSHGSVSQGMYMNQYPMQGYQQSRPPSQQPNMGPRPHQPSNASTRIDMIRQELGNRLKERILPRVIPADAIFVDQTKFASQMVARLLSKYVFEAVNQSDETLHEECADYLAQMINVPRRATATTENRAPTTPQSVRSQMSVGSEHPRSLAMSTSPPRTMSSNTHGQFNHQNFSNNSHSTMADRSYQNHAAPSYPMDPVVSSSGGAGNQLVRSAIEIAMNEITSSQNLNPTGRSRNSANFMTSQPARTQPSESVVQSNAWIAGGARPQHSHHPQNQMLPSGPIQPTNSLQPQHGYAAQQPHSSTQRSYATSSGHGRYPVSGDSNNIAQPMPGMPQPRNIGGMGDINEPSFKGSVHSGIPMQGLHTTSARYPTHAPHHVQGTSLQSGNSSMHPPAQHSVPHRMSQPPNLGVLNSATSTELNSNIPTSASMNSSAQVINRPYPRAAQPATNTAKLRSNQEPACEQVRQILRGSNITLEALERWARRTVIFDAYHTDKEFFKFITRSSHFRDEFHYMHLLYGPRDQSSRLNEKAVASRIHALRKLTTIARMHVENPCYLCSRFQEIYRNCLAARKSHRSQANANANANASGIARFPGGFQASGTVPPQSYGQAAMSRPKPVHANATSSSMVTSSNGAFTALTNTSSYRQGKSSGYSPSAFSHPSMGSISGPRDVFTDFAQSLLARNEAHKAHSTAPDVAAPVAPQQTQVQINGTTPSQPGLYSGGQSQSLISSQRKPNIVVLDPHATQQQQAMRAAEAKKAYLKKVTGKIKVCCEDNQQLFDPFYCLCHQFDFTTLSAYYLSLSKGFSTYISPQRLRSLLLGPLKEIMARDSKKWFHRPVDPTEQHAPDYFTKIDTPMDLGTMKKRLDGGHYKSVDAFKRDLQLIWTNAMKYNSHEHPIHQLAKDLYNFSIKRVELALTEEPEFKKYKELYAANGNRTENLCSLCNGGDLKFQPPQVFCNLCDKKIKEGGYFFSDAQQKYHICKTCYDKQPKPAPIAIGDLKVSHEILQRRQHVASTSEPWVQCDICQRWQHMICSMFNGKRSSAAHISGYQYTYTCPRCLNLYMRYQKVRNTNDKCRVPGAPELPKYHTDSIMEEAIRKKMISYQDSVRVKRNIQRVPADAIVPKITVRVMANTHRNYQTGAVMRARYSNDENSVGRNYPQTLPHMLKAIYLFQNLDGVDTLLFAMYMQEYGNDCPAPNARSAYLSYLDTVKYMRPVEIRTSVYQELLIKYLEDLRRRGFDQLILWACPPKEGDDYIIYCHPQESKTPKDTRLQKWYLTILEEAQNRGIIERITWLPDDFWPSAWGREGGRDRDITQLPNFEGDYWPRTVEDECKDLMEPVLEGPGPEILVSSSSTQTKYQIQSDKSSSTDSNLIQGGKFASETSKWAGVSSPMTESSSVSKSSTSDQNHQVQTVPVSDERPPPPPPPLPAAETSNDGLGTNTPFPDYNDMDDFMEGWTDSPAISSGNVTGRTKLSALDSFDDDSRQSAFDNDAESSNVGFLGKSSGQDQVGKKSIFSAESDDGMTDSPLDSSAHSSPQNEKNGQLTSQPNDNVSSSSTVSSATTSTTSMALSLSTTASTTSTMTTYASEKSKDSIVMTSSSVAPVMGLSALLPSKGVDNQSKMNLRSTPGTSSGQGTKTAVNKRNRKNAARAIGIDGTPLPEDEVRDKIMSLIIQPNNSSMPKSFIVAKLRPSCQVFKKFIPVEEGYYKYVGPAAAVLHRKCRGKVNVEEAEAELKKLAYEAGCHPIRYIVNSSRSKESVTRSGKTASKSATKSTKTTRKTKRGEDPNKVLANRQLDICALSQEAWALSDADLIASLGKHPLANHFKRDNFVFIPESSNPLDRELLRYTRKMLQCTNTSEESKHSPKQPIQPKSTITTADHTSNVSSSTDNGAALQSSSSQSSVDNKSDTTTTMISNPSTTVLSNHLTEAKPSGANTFIRGRITLPDPEPEIHSDFFATRQLFLDLCRGNNFQFDQLRRARHSSMMILHHLHNTDAPAFVHHCNHCQAMIAAGARFACTVCDDVDFCENCKDTAGHPHPLEEYSVNGDLDQLDTGRDSYLILGSTSEHIKERQPTKNGSIAATLPSSAASNLSNTEAQRRRRRDVAALEAAVKGKPELFLKASYPDSPQELETLYKDIEALLQHVKQADANSLIENAPLQKPSSTDVKNNSSTRNDDVESNDSKTHTAVGSSGSVEVHSVTNDSASTVSTTATSHVTSNVATTDTSNTVTSNDVLSTETSNVDNKSITPVVATVTDGSTYTSMTVSSVASTVTPTMSTPSDNSLSASANIHDTAATSITASAVSNVPSTTTTTTSSSTGTMSPGHTPTSKQEVKIKTEQTNSTPHDPKLCVRCIRYTHLVRVHARITQHPSDGTCDLPHCRKERAFILKEKDDRERRAMAASLLVSRDRRAAAVNAEQRSGKTYDDQEEESQENTESQQNEYTTKSAASLASEGTGTGTMSQTMTNISNTISQTSSSTTETMDSNVGSAVVNSLDRPAQDHLASSEYLLNAKKFDDLSASLQRQSDQRPAEVLNECYTRTLTKMRQNSATAMTEPGKLEQMVKAEAYNTYTSWVTHMERKQASLEYARKFDQLYAESQRRNATAQIDTLKRLYSGYMARLQKSVPSGQPIDRAKLEQRAKAEAYIYASSRMKKEREMLRNSAKRPRENDINDPTRRKK